MLRKLIAVAAVMTTLSCADPGAVTSPDAAAPLAANASLARCTADQGQQFIDAGEYDKAIREFSCVIDRDPTGVEGYRGRIEAQLMLGLFSDAVRDYTRVMAFVEPVHPDAAQVILAGYAARLAAAPDAVTALTGKSFAHWWFFDYPAAMHVADKLLAAQPNDVYGTLFRGSSRVLQGTKRAEGAADLERAYTYGSLRDPQRAFTEASFALDRGLDTPRIRAILGASHNAFGDLLAAAAQIKIHLELVTTELVTTSPLAAGSSANLAVVPARTYDIPVAVAAGETLSIATSSKDFWDTILVLLAPDGSPVVGSDDYKGYFAGLDWVAPAAGTYRLRVTSFEAVSTGELLVARK
jgi:tetratricopeptide (TPR) repeat protein